MLGAEWSYVCGGMMAGSEGKKMLDYIASAICHYSDVEIGKLERVEMWTRLPRRSRILGTSSAGNEYQQSSRKGGHGKPHDSDSKVEQALYDV